jgi:hypothetical protein
MLRFLEEAAPPPRVGTAQGLSANRWPGGDSPPALLAALRQAGVSKRRGADACFAGLGYPEGRSGEVRMLTNLRRLRAAFAEQQGSTLGRSVWRAR